MFTVKWIKQSHIASFADEKLMRNTFLDNFLMKQKQKQNKSLSAFGDCQEQLYHVK